MLAGLFLFKRNTPKPPMINEVIEIVLRYFIVKKVSYNFKFLKRSEFVITDTELKLMATAAIIGDSKISTREYKITTAFGMPGVL